MSSPKNTLRDQIKKNVAENASDELTKLHVEAFQADVFFSPLTAGDIARIQRKHPTFLSGDGGGFGVECVVDLIILKVCDGDGEKLFDQTDKMWLKGRSYQTLANIGGAIVGSTMSVEDHEGN